MQIEEKLQVTSGSQGFVDVLRGRLSDDALVQRLSGLDVVLLPRAGNALCEVQAFTSELHNLVRFFDENCGDLRFDVATNDDSPPEVILHGALLDIGTLLLTGIAAPVVATLLSNFIWDRIRRDRHDPTETEVRCELTITNADGSSKEIRYSGPAHHFETVARESMGLRPPSDGQK